MTLIDPEKIPKHVAIIMDGNGRWAEGKKQDRIFGHQNGLASVKEIVKTSYEIGIKWLTLYAFSEENWIRPRKEINALMFLLKLFLQNEEQTMLEKGIRLQSIGRTNKLPDDTQKVLYDTIEKTSSNSDLILTLALSYGGKQEIVDAAKKIAEKTLQGSISTDDITEQLFSEHLYAPKMPDPDLLIRTSGEHRISNFLLWQIGYTELYITPTLWPDFRKDEYIEAILDFQKRVRRFGGTRG